MFEVIYKKRKNFLPANIKLGVVLIVVSLVLAACSLPKLTISPTKPQPAAKQHTSKEAPAKAEKKRKNIPLAEQLSQQTKIKKFSSYQELKEFLDNNATLSTASQASWGGSYGAVANTTRDKKALAPLSLGQKESLSSQTNLPATSPDYSRTNIQVEGVDEADIIKTDGSYIYAVAKKNLFIIKAKPAQEAEVLAMIKFKNTPQEIYVQGNSLVVYGRDSEIYKILSAPVADKIFYPRRRNYVFLKVFDITDKKNPRQVRDLDFEGYYSSSRLIDNYLYFITYNYVNYYFEDDIPVPRILSQSKVIPVGCAEKRCYNPPIYYIDIPNTNYNFVTVSAINIKDNQVLPQSEVYLLPASQNIFASRRNIYLTYTKYISEYDLYMVVAREVVVPLLSPRRQKQIAEIESVPNYILSPKEKQQKVFNFIQYYLAALPSADRKKIENKINENIKQKYTDINKELQKTVIHKIAVSQGKLKYQAQGEVVGRVLNQFAMNEAGNYFYIATTRDRSWGRRFLLPETNLVKAESQNESYSNLYVLDKNLKVVGSLEKLAPGEKIHSVRFMQKRAYLVTFRQIDPLFVIDLTKPTKPQVLGKLKIPGYSDYLHPYDDATLIGLGKETATSSWGGVVNAGLKISLFDVSDVAHPKEIAKYVLGERGSDSLALRNHKAFQFWPQKHLLVIPVTLRKPAGNNTWGRFNFNGAVVFLINKNEIKLKGKINHQDKASNGLSYPDYDTQVKRSLYIGDVIYTFSNKYLGLNSLDNLELIKKLPLKKEPNKDFEIIN